MWVITETYLVANMIALTTIMVWNTYNLESTMIHKWNYQDTYGTSLKIGRGLRATHLRPSQRVEKETILSL